MRCSRQTSWAHHLSKLKLWTNRPKSNSHIKLFDATKRAGASRPVEVESRLRTIHFTVVRDEINRRRRRNFQLPQHCGDLTPMVRRVIDHMADQLGKRLLVSHSFQVLVRQRLSQLL